MASLKFRVYQKINPSVDFSIFLENKKTKESLLFQANTVSTLAQHETDAMRADQYGRILDAYGCLGVLQVCPRENTQYYLVVITRCIKVCSIENSAICKIQDVDIISLQSMRPQNYKPQDDEPWLRELKKLLGNESFYFSVPLKDNEVFDITLCAQRRAKGAPSDNKFFWNRMLHLHLKRFGVNCKQWLIKVMCGSVEFATLYMNNHTPKIVVISRLSCERAGTRFNVRGVNDAGHVANFVETEQLIHVDTMDNLVLSYIQIRGTVPLFWEQPGLNVGSHKVKMSREPEVSVQAFWNHVRFLREKYGRFVVLNLLGTGVTGKRQGEAALSHLFQFQHLNCKWSKDDAHIVFDFHQECKGGSAEAMNAKLKPQINEEINSFGFFISKNGVVEQIQTGVMRSNCLDCLDRTNRVQSFLAMDVMRKKLEVMGVSNNGVAVQRFTSKLDEMWKDNGNRISLNYAGTGALQGSKLIDGARSAGRMIQNNLLDNSKQEAIDIMLHGNLLNNYLATLSRTLLPSKYLYAPLSVLKQVCDRSPEYCEPVKFRVAVGTYNVNGGKHFRSLAYKHLSLDDWLLDSQKNEGKTLLIDMSPSNEDIDVIPADIFAIGFEEIVDLTAQNIVQNTQWSENANSWGRELQKVISRDEKYVMVTWKQLVGVALFVFVHQRHAGCVRDVSVETVKTGLQGATGNKGAVGIRMIIRNTSMAFVCSHFAAGQKEVNERNSDYDTIARKLIFNMGVPLWAHDYVFWCGDFNYRINKPRDEVISNIQQQEWSLLLEQDQLSISQKEGKCFKGFTEGAISFAPTYKYDLFSDDYDTSEKCRVPAWTDRILFWARRYPWQNNNPNWSPGKIVHYGRAELKQSDHRPVLALIDVEGRKAVNDRLEDVYQSVVHDQGPSDCTVVLYLPGVGAEDLSTILSDEMLDELNRLIEDVGSIVLSRLVQDGIYVTFKDSKSALEAVLLGHIQVGSYDFHVRLKTEDWLKQLQEELDLCRDTTVPLLEEDIDFDEDLQDSPDLTLECVEDMMSEFYVDDQDLEVPCEELDKLTPTQETAKPLRPAPPRPAPCRPAPPAPSKPARPSRPKMPVSSKESEVRSNGVSTVVPPRPDSLFSTGSTIISPPSSNDRDQIFPSVDAPTEMPVVNDVLQSNPFESDSTCASAWPDDDPFDTSSSFLPLTSKVSPSSAAAESELHSNSQSLAETQPPVNSPPLTNPKPPVSSPPNAVPQPPVDTPPMADPQLPVSSPPLTDPQLPMNSPPLTDPQPPREPPPVPPSLPPRSPAHSTKTRELPAVPPRSLPPVPARKLPPIPPRK